MTGLRVGAACFILALAGTAPAMAAEGSADQQFKAIYTSEWAWRQGQRLEPDEDTGSEVQSRLPVVDAASQAARLRHWQDVMAQLDAIRPDQLSTEQRIDYRIYRDQIQVLINQQTFRDYERPLNADTSFWGNLAASAHLPLKSEQDYESYIASLRDMPRYFREETDNMRAGLNRGFTPPKVTLEGRDATIAAVAEAATPQENIFYGPFRDMPGFIPADRQAALRAQGVKAIVEDVVPAHRALLKFMREDYIPRAQTSIAAEAWPGGKAYYASKIREFTTTALTPDQIHQIGLDEVARIHGEMLAVMKQAGFQGDLPAFLHFLRTDPQFYATTPQDLLNRAAWIAKEFDGKASQDFGYLPRMRFAIRPVPADVAPFYTGGRGGPGVYLVNTYNLPSRPLYSLPSLTLHESAPGHAFQMPIALEHKDQPEFRQKVYISAYGEGWALYCERLGTEMGMYHTPYETFGMLSNQAWRAARLVVDTGIHHMGWTREQARKYLHDNTALADHEIETEVDRYVAWPGQALSYYLGEMDIQKNRKRAEQALGAKFNIRAFHDAALEMGSVPLPVLDTRIDRFIAEGGKGPYPEME